MKKYLVKYKYIVEGQLEMGAKNRTDAKENYHCQPNFGDNEVVTSNWITKITQIKSQFEEGQCQECGEPLNNADGIYCEMCLVAQAEKFRE